MRDPADAVETLATWGWAALPLVAVVTLLFGGFSTAAPRRSIALYQRLMAWFNWRVSPIDEPRELRTTRVLGVLLVLLSLVVWWQIAVQRR